MMPTTFPALLPPHAYVWDPSLDAHRNEHAPDGANQIRAVHFRRSVGPFDTSRTVRLETMDGDRAALPRLIHHHGDLDEGWDWGWRGSAPLDTGLNVLAAFTHPKAAWRLQWAFYDAFLHGMAAAGGTIDGSRLRAWIAEHGWIGRQRDWHTTAAAEVRNPLRLARRESRRLTPEARACEIARQVRAAMGWTAVDAEAAAREHGSSLTRDLWGIGGREPGTAEHGLDLAAALLEGAPPRERAPTLAALVDLLPPEGSAPEAEWDAHALGAGLPHAAAVRGAAEAAAALGPNTAPRERAARLAGIVRQEASGRALPWTGLPALSYGFGGALSGGIQGALGLDPVWVASTLYAFRAAAAEDPSLAAAAARLGLDEAALRDLQDEALSVQLGHVRREAEELDREASRAREYASIARQRREPRRRAPAPPPTSGALRRWLLGIPVDLLTDLARVLHADGSGVAALGQALDSYGVPFPDPLGSIARAVAWYAEERAPHLLDQAPAFTSRGDGLTGIPPALDAGLPWTRA